MAHLVICSKCGKQFDRDKIQAVRSGPRRYAHYECMPEGELVPLPVSKAAPILKKTEENQILLEKAVEQQKERELDIDEEEHILRKLTDYIQKLYGKDNVNWPFVMRQIQNYKRDFGYTYSGMLKSLIYYYEVKKNPVGIARGVGIIPHAYKDAYNYYYSLFLAKCQNEKIDFKEITSKTREITIKPPSIKKKIKMFNEEEENNE